MRGAFQRVRPPGPTLAENHVIGSVACIDRQVDLRPSSDSASAGVACSPPGLDLPLRRTMRKNGTLLPELVWEQKRIACYKRSAPMERRSRDGRSRLPGARGHALQVSTLKPEAFTGDVSRRCRHASRSGRMPSPYGRILAWHPVIVSEGGMSRQIEMRPSCGNFAVQGRPGVHNVAERTIFRPFRTSPR